MASGKKQSRVAFSRYWLYALLMMFWIPAQGQELPQQSWLNDQLKQAEALEPANPVRVEKLISLKDSLSQYKDLQQELADLNARVQSAPSIRQELQGKIKNAHYQTSERNQGESVEEIQLNINALMSRSKTWRSQLEDIDVQQQQLNDQQDSIPAEIAELEQQLARSAVELSDINPGSTDELIEFYHRLADKKVNDSRLKLLNLKQDSILIRGQLLKLQKELLNRQLSRATIALESAQQQLQRRQSQRGHELLDKAQLQTESLADGPLIASIWSEKNEKLAARSAQVITDLSISSNQYREIEEERQLMQLSMGQIRSNIRWLIRNANFSQTLRTQLERLPVIPAEGDHDSQIATLYQRRLTYTRELLNLNDVPEFINEQIPVAGTFTPDELTALRDVLYFRVQLINEYVRHTDQQIYSLTRLEGLKKQFADEIELSNEYLREKQLLIRGKLRFDDLKDPDIKLLLGTDNLLLNTRDLLGELNQYRTDLVMWGLFFILLILVMRLLGRFEQELTNSYGKLIGNVHNYRFWQPLALCCVNLLLAAVKVSWIAVFYFWMEMRWGSYSQSLDLNSLIRAFIFLAFIGESLVRLANKGGLLEKHLSWPSSLTLWLRSRMSAQRWFFYLIFISMIGLEIMTGTPESIVSRLMFVALIILLFQLMYRLLKADRIPVLMPEVARSSLSLFLIRVLVLTPLLAMIALSLLGYFYASWLLLQYHLVLLLIFLAALMLHDLGERWLRIEQRRLTYQRALEARQEKLKREQAGQFEEADIEESQLAVEDISEQSMALLNVTIVFTLLACLFALGKDSLFALQWLDEIAIWPGSLTGSAVGENDLSLKELLFGFTVLGLSLFAAHNLPGILELLVLRRMSVSPGAAYAITTLLRYAILIFGTVVGLSALGFHWSQLQWLVAALGVGLGFGLQEIFANLVSGIILLFERPVRVGDTVTINNLSGTVARINTRATTIIDWDKKEILVPNKTLITEQLINWSLTDGLNRLVIPLGVAYGSDVALVKRLLLESTEGLDEIMKDPGPQVLFIQFGASSLDFELRVYLPRTDLRLTYQDSLNTRIDSLMREYQIEIAFPQMDLHIRDLPNALQKDISKKGT